jgi:1-acyl-sn-glycerol-3-phosphate acyltransferase
MRIFYKVLRSHLKFLFTLFYRHKVYGLEQFPEGGAIIACNHNSFIDPPLVGASCPEEVFYFARASLFEHYLLNKIITNLNAYPLKGNTDDLASFKLIASLLEKKKKVLIFPEGIRSSTGELCKFKNGVAMLALRSECPIIPVYIHGTFNIWSRFRKFPKFKGSTACIFGQPITVDAFKELTKKEAQEKITEQLRDSIQSLRLWYETDVLKHYKKKS